MRTGGAPRRAAVALLGGAALVAAALGGCDGSGGRVDASATPTSRAAPAPSSTLGRTPAPAAPTTAAATTTTTAVVLPPGPRSITLAFAGDLLPHGPINNQAAANGRASGRPYDYRPMLAPLTPTLQRADVAICHMEVPVHPPGQAVTTYPSFGAPPELVDAVKAVGYDGCSTASNHSLDRGFAGITATLDRFDGNQLLHAGTARSQRESVTAATYVVGGVRIAHLSYAYGFNGYRLPAGAPWAANPIDPARIRRDARRVRSHGADLVIVSLHWGTEYDSRPSSYQRQVASEILPSPDIDLVVGHHAHVVQPIGSVGGKFVIWGLGNQLANQRQVPRSDGLTVLARAVLGWDLKWHVIGVEAVPTWIEPGSFRVLPVVPTLRDPALPAWERDELRRSYDRTVSTVRREGTAGVTVARRS